MPTIRRFTGDPPLRRSTPGTSPVRRPGRGPRTAELPTLPSAGWAPREGDARARRSVPLAEPQRGEVSAAEPKPAPRVDWGEALDVPTFYDREPELATLSRWVVEEGCRLVSVLGMGVMGKSALAVRAMPQLAGHLARGRFLALPGSP